MQALTQDQIDQLEQKWVEIRSLLEASEQQENAKFIECLHAYLAFFMDFAKQDNADKADEMQTEITQLQEKLTEFYNQSFEEKSQSEALLTSFRKLRYYIIWFFGKFAAANLDLRIQLIESIYKHDYQLNLVGLEVIIANLKAEVEQLKQTIDTLQTNLEEANANIAKLEDTLTQKQAKIDECEAKITELTTDLAQAIEKVTVQEKTIEEHVATITKHEQDIADKQQQQVSLTESLAQRDKDIATLKQEKQQLQTELDASNTESKKLTTSIEQLEEKLAAKDAKIVELEAAKNSGS